MNDKKQKSFEKKQELIEAALREFSDKGYEQASLNNILKEAGISKGTFYYHFENKEELYLYLIGILVDKKMEFFSKNTNPEDYNKDIFTILNIQGKLGIQFAQQNPQISSFSESFLKEKENEIYKKAMGRYNFVKNDYFGHLIDRAYSRGDLREDLPKEFVARLIGYLFTNIQDISNSTKIGDFEEAFSNLIEFIKDGLAKK